ncbi:BGTF surface domain-containing protein [Natrarchaeobaculum aegyptiacum]|uniref:BIG2 domain-containing protein n=1 Tax=Natrarchaeobaculum aegyptiacum TaxID=745377 RepID=A0A2Z2HS58_9EURY|nr:BGTF surface domain-containing protein [Natrarchaeobaculum aegyptiacum]ARS89633.1 hypothetical protein B1756_07710 [Natrarchaeobaculum aegyptiacum]
MTQTTYRDKGRAVTLAVLLIVSVVAMSATVAGGAAAIDTVEESPGQSTALSTHSSVASVEEIDGGSFEATNTHQEYGGSIAIGAESEGDFQDEGLEFSNDEGDHIAIEAEIDDDGTWESTDVQFPEIDHDLADEVIAETPDGLAGEIDVENDEMTIEEGLFEVSVETLLGDGEFEFEASPTSGSSGALEGEADFDSESGTAVLVDNEYTVEDTSGDGTIDDALGLPSENAGENWMELPLEFEFDLEEGEDPEPEPEPELEIDLADTDIEEDETTAATVTLLEGDEEEDVTAAADLSSSDESVVTVDDDGTVEAVADGEATVEAEYDGESASASVTVDDADDGDDEDDEDETDPGTLRYLEGDGSDTGSVIFQGQTVYAVGEAFDAEGEEYELREADSFDDGIVDDSSFEEELTSEHVEDLGIDAALADGDYGIEIETDDLEDGDFFLTGPGLDASPSQSDTVEVTAQSLDADFDAETVTNEGADTDVDLELDSQRGSYSVNVSADGDLDDEELFAMFLAETYDDRTDVFEDDLVGDQLGLNADDHDVGDVVAALRDVGAVLEPDATGNPQLYEGVDEDLNVGESDVTFGAFDVGLWHDDVDELVVLYDVSDGEHGVDVTGIDEDEYDFEFAVTDTDASSSDELTVTDSDVEAEFVAHECCPDDDSVYTQAAGDPVHLTVDLEDTDDAFLVFGDEDVGYADIVYVEDGTGNGEVNVTLNTRIMGTGNPYAVVDDEDTVKSLIDTIDLDDPLTWIAAHHVDSVEGDSFADDPIMQQALDLDDDGTLELPEPFDELELYEDDVDGDSLSFVEFLGELELLSDPADDPGEFVDLDGIDPGSIGGDDDLEEVMAEAVDFEAADTAYDQLDRPLQPTAYTISSSSDGVFVADDGDLEVDDELDSAVVDLTEPGLGEAEVLVAPGDDADAHHLTEYLDPEVEEATPTPRSEVAEDDRLIVRADASGIFGHMVVIADEGDYDPLTEDGFEPRVIYDLNELEGEGVTLEIEASDSTGNQDPNAVDFENAEIDEVVAFANHLDGELYVVVDTSASGAFERDLEDGETFEASIEYAADEDERFSLHGIQHFLDPEDPMPWQGDADDGITGDAAFPYFEPDRTETVTTEFSVAEPTVEFAHLDDEGDVEIEASDEAVVMGETNVAPGSTADVRITNAGETESFLTTTEAAIGSDGSFSTDTIDFSERDVGDEAEVEFRVDGSAVGDEDGVFAEQVEVEAPDDEDDERGPGETPRADDPEEVAATINEEYIAPVNAGLEDVNDGLENADDLAYVENVSASDWDEAEAEADRLRERAPELQDELYDAVVEEINIQAADTPLGGDIARDVETPDEARAEADRLREEYGLLGGDDIEEAAESLEFAADLGEAIDENLLRAADQLQPPETGQLEGTVIDENGDPIAGIDVTPVESSASATTGDDGAFSLEVPEGTQPIRVSGDGYETVEEVVEIDGDEPATLEVELERADEPDDSVSGFGLVAAVGALLAVALLARRAGTE